MQNNYDIEQNITYEDLTPEQSAEQTAPKRKGKGGKILMILLVVALIAFVGCLLCKWFWISNIGVSGISMMPNYKGDQRDYDVVWVNKNITPNRGDVVVFYVNEVNKFLGEFASGKDVKEGGKYEKYIKRVVAIGGDKIWWEQVDAKRCRLVIVTADGQKIYENQDDNVYYRHGKQAQFYQTSGGSLSTVPYFQIPVDESTDFFCCDSEASALVIPEGYMFVMGDNRFASKDSRALGAFPVKNVYGVVINP